MVHEKLGDKESEKLEGLPLVIILLYNISQISKHRDQMNANLPTSFQLSLGSLKQTINIFFYIMMIAK